MNLRHLLLAFVLATPLTASAAAAANTSMLRVTCAGDDVGAEVSINGKFKGECPLDMNVAPGMLKLRVEKKADASHERFFEQEIRMGEGVVKKVEAVLTTRLTAAAQKLEDERIRQQAAAEQAVEQAVINNMEMVVVPAGSFNMGSGKSGSESPVHSVTFRQAFALGKTEVTQGQWKAVMGSNPSQFTSCGDNCPVEQVSWNDVQEFLQKLNARTGKQYRLPSEAEWEYACYGGSRTEYCGGNDLNAVAWYDDDSNHSTHPAGQKQANGYGLYDMSGNVWEWTEDSYHANYNGAPNDGSEWQGDGAIRMLRGGSWYDYPQKSRSAFRGFNSPVIRDLSIGFRLARTLPQ